MSLAVVDSIAFYGVKAFRPTIRAAVLALFLAGFVLAPPLAVSGQTDHLGTIQGKVTGPGDAVIPRAAVIIRRTDVPENSTVQTETDSDGAFTVSHLAAGSYIVSAKAKIVGRPFSRPVVVKGGETVTADITLYLKPCSDEAPLAAVGSLTDEDEVEIVSDLIRRFYQKDKVKNGVEKALTIDNFKAKWLTSDQQVHVREATKDLLQPGIKRDRRKYHVISKPYQTGECVGFSVSTGDYIGSSYEYRKQNDKWSGIWLSGWIN